MAVKESISTIIPCFNEEESIPLIYDELKRVLKDIKNVFFIRIEYPLLLK